MKKNHFANLFCLFLLTVFVNSCKKDFTIPLETKDDYPETSYRLTSPDIYIAGWENSSGGISIAKYWENGTPVSLTNGTKAAEANAITIAVGDIYVAGFESNSSDIMVAKYWINGAPVSLTDGTKDAVATSIAVSGTDIYVAGYEKNSSGIWIAKYWDNGTPVSLSSGTTDAFAYGIAVSGTDVYVVGTEDNYAKYWVNGSGSILYNDYDIYGDFQGRATAIKILNGDIYISGDFYHLPYEPLYISGVECCQGLYIPLNTVVYWKNNELNFLSSIVFSDHIAMDWAMYSENYSTSIAVSDDIVYLSGRSIINGPSPLPNRRYKATCWRSDDYPYVFPGGNANLNAVSYANGIETWDGDVYICGLIKNTPGDFGVATYWINDSPVALTDGTKPAGANAIFLE